MNLRPLGTSTILGQSESERERSSRTGNSRESMYPFLNTLPLLLLLADKKSKEFQDESPSAKYSLRIHNHASLSTKGSLFPGQNYRTLARYLRQPFQQSHSAALYQPNTRDEHSGSFATLYNLNADDSDRVVSLPNPEFFESLMEEILNDSSSSLLLFLRGHPSSEWLNSVGSMCNVHPEFFQRHVEFWSTIGMPDYFPLPPLPSSSGNIIKLQLTTIGSRGSVASKGPQASIDRLRRESAKDFERYFHELRTTDNFRTGDSFVRHLEVYDETHFSLEQDVSICVNRLGNGWIGKNFMRNTIQIFTDFILAVIWMDVGSDLSIRSSAPLFSTLLGKQSTSELYPTIQYRPDSAWTQDLLQHQHSSSSQGDFTQSASLLHENYGLLLQPKLAAADALYALSEMFTFAAHSERQFLNLMQSKITRELDFSSNSEVAPSLSNLIHSKRVLTRHIHRLKENVLAIETKGGLSTETILDQDWPHADGDGESQQVKIVAHTLFRDFKHLLSQAEALSEQCDRGMTVFMNSAMIAESKRAIKQAEGVGKLTFLAFFYIPLSFTASFFGMNFHQLGTGTLSIWVWFVASSFMTAVTFLFLWLSTGGLRGHLAQATSRLKTRFRRI
jgi:hypothetical protein